MTILLQSAAELIAQVVTDRVNSNECVLIMVGEQSADTVKDIISGFRGLGICFVGGIFPAVIFNNQSYSAGIIWKKFPLACEPLFFPSLNAHCFEPEKVSFPEKLMQGSQDYSALCFVDGLSGGTGSFLTQIYDFLGDSCSYFGAGAGFWNFPGRECIFSADGIFADAGFLLILDLEARVAIAHGFEPCSEPLLATSVFKSVELRTLAWQPAFDVYQRIVEKDSGKKVTPENLKDTGRLYPIGVVREKAESIIREALRTNENGSLYLGGGIFENAVIQIMRGSKDRMLQAAKEVLEEIAPEADMSVSGALIVDCISRHENLGSDFGKELDLLYNGVTRVTGKKNVLGILSLGEIASSSLDGFLDIHNKTLALAYFVRRSNYGKQ